MNAETVPNSITVCFQAFEFLVGGKKQPQEKFGIRNGQGQRNFFPEKHNSGLILRILRKVFV
jgi:hypothetical protein